MKTILESLHAYKELEEPDAYKALKQIITHDCNNTQAAAFLSAYIMRPPSVAEISGFRRAMLELATPVKLDVANTLDIVGTGGDGKNTFNISTLSALVAVAAAAGVKVVKHGNYAATSVSGSSDVLQYLGYRFTDDHSVLQRQLDTCNICFLHAPLFHAAIGKIAPIRKELGLRTFFNLLGPLVNPAQPSHQLLGVSKLEMMRTYHYVLQNTPQQYTIVHSLDGYDEISLTGPFKIMTQTQEEIIHPETVGFKKIAPATLHAGNTIQDAASIFLSILQGNGTSEQNNVVIANSSYAIKCMHPGKSLSDCLDMAEEALLSKQAYHNFKQLIQTT